MTIGLALLVRDEADTIERAIIQCEGIVDHVTVLDTGSLDGTQDIARSLGADVYEREWDGFGPSRTALLELARRSGTEYTLMLDADHVLHVHCARCGTDHAPAQTEGGDPSGPSGTGCSDVLARPDLDADEYMLRIRDDGGRLPLLTRTRHPFRYEGVAHAYLCSDGAPTVAHTDWLSIDGGPGASRQKLERDLILLKQAHIDDPTDRRTCFYLAQTYRDLDQHEEAIHYYRLRAQMGGWPEEVYWARYQAGVLLSEHVSFQQGAHHLLAAWETRPCRVEALRALANSANAVAAKLPIPDDVLFVQHAAYAATT